MTSTELEEEAYRARRRAEAELAMILDSVPALIFHKDRDHRLISANTAMVRALGKPREEIIGKTDAELGTPYAAQYAQDEDEIASTGQPKLGMVEPLMTASGVRWLQTDKVPVRDFSGEVVGYIGLAVDITARKWMEEALRASEADFRASFHSTAIGQAQVEPISGRYMRVNRRFCEITGYTEPELLALTFRDITHPEDRESDDAAHEKLVEGELLELDREKRYIRKDGSSVWVSLNASLITDSSGQPWRTLAVVQDISQRKAMEEARRAHEARAVWLGSFPEQNPNPIFELKTARGPVHYANPAARIVFPDLDERGAKHPLFVGLAEEMEKAAAQNIECARRDVVVDGLWYAQSIQRFQGEERIRMYLTDITPRRAAEDAVRTLNSQLEERVTERTAQLEVANKELEAFSYTVSHDLRAPLRHINGYVEMLLRACDGQLSDKALRYLRVITDSSKQMGRLIDDLLAFSRTGRSELRMRAVDLEALAAEVVRELGMTAPDRDVHWSIGPLPRVQGDPGLMKIVLTNLLGNAFKYTRNATPARIEMGAAPASSEPGKVEIHVRDNGVGFDMKYAGKLFGVFQRLHRAEDFEGTGIGLATVRRILVRHGGNIVAESAPGQGATFRVTLLPAAEPPSHAGAPS